MCDMNGPHAWRFDLGNVDDRRHYVPTYRQLSSVGSSFGLRRYGPEFETLAEAFAWLRSNPAPVGSSGLGVRHNGVTILATVPRRRQLRLVSSRPSCELTVGHLCDVDLVRLAGAGRALTELIHRRYEKRKFAGLLFAFGLLDAVPTAQRVMNQGRGLTGSSTSVGLTQSEGVTAGAVTPSVGLNTASRRSQDEV
jgi:hypothetical protein